MRLTAACLVVALSASAAAAPARAQVAQDATTGLVTCTTTAGQHTRRIITGVAEGGRISGMVRLVRPDPSPRYTAAAGFLFKEASEHHVALEIALRPGTTNRMVYGVQMPGEARLTEFGEAAANLWYPLAISISNGIMTVQVGQQVTRRRVRLSRPLLPVLHCNSGTFEFRLGPGLGLGEAPVNVNPNAPPARAPGGGGP